MRRWLIGSLALNVLLIGIGAGALIGEFIQPPPPPSPFGPRPGIQRDLMIAVETGLSGEARAQAREIVARHADRNPPPVLPRAEDVLGRFVEGEVPKLPDFTDPVMEQRRKREAETLRKIFAEFADVLDRPQRAALADALRRRVGEVRACIDAGDLPR